MHYLENTAAKFPEKTALADSTGTLTFKELRDNSLKAAGYISRRLKGTRRRPVFVYLPKSKESIVSFFGIAYSGNFYTPADVNFPFAKAEAIIKSLEPALIVTDEKNAEKLKANGVSGDMLALYNDMLTENAPFDKDAALLKIIDTDPLYVLYTSGSTGVPKGVIICHKSVRDYIDFLVNKFGFDEKMKIASQAPLYFDNSVLDIYTCIAAGAALYITPESYFSFPAKLMQYITENGINFVFWVPSALIHVANSGILDEIDCSCLTNIIFAGEVMPNKQLNIWRKKLPGAEYINLYGPTEITVDCTYYIIEREFTDDEPLPIGFPCDNTDVMLFDDNNKLITEPGRQGELCVRGTSLSLGYWNNPQKTAEVFVQNPLHNNYEEKIYRTGDLAHYNEHGEIMFDGRKDFQIKHMGHRIELGEIETAAAAVSGVNHACADYDTELSQIMLFYTGSPGDIEIRKALMSKLPRYMVPGIYKKIHAMPLNDNGKIDRKALREGCF